METGGTRVRVNITDGGSRKTAREKHNSRRKERTKTNVRSLTGSTEDVSAGELPHASEELGKSTSEDGHPYDHIGGVDTTGVDIHHGKQECRRSEGEQAAIGYSVC